MSAGFTLAGVFGIQARGESLDHDLSPSKRMGFGKKVVAPVRGSVPLENGTGP
jgi:hypothetical protein